MYSPFQIEVFPLKDCQLRWRAMTVTAITDSGRFYTDAVQSFMGLMKHLNKKFHEFTNSKSSSHVVVFIKLHMRDVGFAHVKITGEDTSLIAMHIHHGFAHDNLHTLLTKEIVKISAERSIAQAA